MFFSSLWQLLLFREWYLLLAALYVNHIKWEKFTYGIWTRDLLFSRELLYPTELMWYLNTKRSMKAPLLAEMRGVEPLSENRSMRLSQGASSDPISLWTISDAGSDTGSHFLRDRLKGEPPMHGHRYMTFSLGARYSQGEQAVLWAAALPIRQPEQLDCCPLVF